MHDGVRRSLIVFIVFSLSAAVLFAWRARDDRFDLFDLLTGKRKQEMKSEEIVLRDKPVLKYSDVPGLARLNEDYKRLTAEVTPAVVSISTGREVNQPMLHRGIFGTRMSSERRWEPGLGSGVIVSENGYVVTNYHVIDHVDTIEVTLADQEETFPVRVAGYNERLDVAVLKIISDDPERKFDHLSLGDSDLVEKGEMVFAVGHPFGYKGTVTHGIISAKNRRLSDSSAEHFQTNAIINPGNSGGPLVNIQGEIIGINSAIASGNRRTGGWQGVGLAIVSNDVRDVLDAVSKRGRPIYGYLGVSYRPALKSGGGGTEVVQIMAVEDGSPAETAGIQAGDIVLEFDGHEVKNFDDFSKRVRRSHPKDTVPIKIARDGEEQLLDVVIGELDEDKLIADRVNKGGADAQAVEMRMRSAGIQVSDIPGGKGVLVERVLPGSPWRKLREGDTIVSLGRWAIPNARTLAFLMEKATPGELATMGVWREFDDRRRRFGRLDVRIPALP